MTDLDARVRAAAFACLDRLRAARRDDDLLRRDELMKGFMLDDRRVPLVSAQQGIFKPAVLDTPLSILTAAVRDDDSRPYEDAIGADGLLRYRYRGRDVERGGIEVDAQVSAS